MAAQRPGGGYLFDRASRARVLRAQLLDDELEALAQARGCALALARVEICSASHRQVALRAAGVGRAHRTRGIGTSSVPRTASYSPTGNPADRAGDLRDPREGIAGAGGRVELAGRPMAWGR